jgi:hypothetical protein
MSVAEYRFAIVFRKLSEAIADRNLAAEIKSIRKESREIAELQDIVAELESGEDVTYTSS